MYVLALSVTRKLFNGRIDANKRDGIQYIKEKVSIYKIIRVNFDTGGCRCNLNFSIFL